jgi:hypothetical protein
MTFRTRLSGNFNAGFIVQKVQSASCFALQSRTNKQTAPARVFRRIGEMSVAVPVAILVLLSANAYGAWIWPNYESEQKEKSEQAEKSSSEKDKSGKAEKSSSAAKSKAKRHRQTERQTGRLE